VKKWELCDSGWCSYIRAEEWLVWVCNRGKDGVVYVFDEGYLNDRVQFCSNAS